MGVASHFLIKLEAIAKENNFKGFTATVLKENAVMLRVFKRHYPKAKISMSGGSDISVVMDFEKNDKTA